MNIIIPMLGRGSKFLQAGYDMPKPLVKVHDKYIFQWALEAISEFDIEKEALFIIHADHVEKGLDKEIIKIVGKGAKIKVVDFIPDGAAKTILLARDEIDTQEPLMIYNADQYFKGNIKEAIDNNPEVDGIIPYFYATHPKWSFIDIDDNNIVKRVAEKEMISSHATVGLYYFREGRDFVHAADAMIKKNVMVANEFYVAPSYNELIVEGKKILAVPVDEMWGLGTPEDVEKFEKYYK